MKNETRQSLTHGRLEIQQQLTRGKLFSFFLWDDKNQVHVSEDVRFPDHRFRLRLTEEEILLICIARYGQPREVLDTHDYSAFFTKYRFEYSLKLTCYPTLKKVSWEEPNSKEGEKYTDWYSPVGIEIFCKYGYPERALVMNIEGVIGTIGGRLVAERVCFDPENHSLRDTNFKTNDLQELIQALDFSVLGENGSVIQMGLGVLTAPRDDYQNFAIEKK